MALPPNMTDYDDMRRTFRLEVPARFNYTRDVIETRARATPEALALLAAGPDGEITRRLTFADLARASNRVANALRAQGVGKGDPVFVMLPRIPEWHLALLGCIRIGAIPMPATPLLTPRDVAYRIGRAEATVALTDGDGARKVDQARAECPTLRQAICVGDGRPDGRWLDWGELVDRASDGPPHAEPTASDDPMIVYFTSGTTGYPKMVLHTQASYGIGHEITARFWQDLHPNDLHWTFSDTGWAKAAWGMLFGQWRIGSGVFVWDVRGKPDFDRMLSMIGRHGVTTFCAPPTVYRAIARDAFTVEAPSLRHLTSAGEPLNPDVMDRWRGATGLQILDGYGQTETVNLVANYRCLPVREGSMGKPTPGFDIRIVDEDGTPLGPGETGHIGVRIAPERPVGLFAEYWRDPRATADATIGEFYDTGDLARVDEDGYVWFVSRADDIITSSAYRIGPFEVESALLEHPAVAEAAVVGKPDELRGEIVKAFVTLKRGFPASDDLARDLQDHVKHLTAPYKYPREIEFLPELPKTVSGKIRRTELRERDRERAA
jgi:acyl-coenzyme A synthetase/AMP-(fatty) acid ligase